MRNIMKIFIMMLSLITSYAQSAPAAFEAKVQNILEAHYKKYRDLEYISGITLAIYLPDQQIKNFYIGTVSRDPNSKKISSDTLFQIGSITKSFVAAVTLQLEREGKLKLDDTLKVWLPQYPKWSAIDIKSLLNMSSGLPNYSDTPLFNTAEYQNPARVWKNEELINFAYPPANFSPPIKQGYFYTNTGYILMDLIIQKATNHSLRQELIDRTIKAANLTNTFYPVPNMDKRMHERLAHNYNYNQYDNPALVGRDLYDNNISWTNAAGAIVSNAEDVTKWIKALFVDNKILNAAEKEKLMLLVSLKTGKTITKVNEEDPHGFGLGVTQAMDNDTGLGRFWFYEGETLGFRALYVYVPCNGVIITSIFNSATNHENDHIGDLIKSVYGLILNQYPQFVCEKA